MALAANVRQYFPPKRIQQMETDLADLAHYWPSGPWGWSIATKQRYLKMGVVKTELPSDEWLDNVRRLSSREFACQYIRQMLSELNDNCLIGNEMRFVTSVNDNTLTPSPSCPMIFKSPWSSSGRGVFVSEAMDTATVQRLNGYVNAQGGFVADRFYRNKQVDFAMEFDVHDDGSVHFLGYSLFHAESNGAYGYNVVAGQDTLLNLIGVDISLLQRLKEYHIAHLGNLGYCGPLGIDMIACADGTVHPCIEINFRMNMGILAILLWEKYHDEHLCIDLTPQPQYGFQAKMCDGKLMIVYETALKAQRQ